MERGVLSSDVIGEHDLHSFACKLLPKTCDFLDVPPVHLRGGHKTGLPVPSILKVTVLPLGDCFVQLSIISKTLRCLRRPLFLFGDGAVNLGIALAQLPDKRVNNAIGGWTKF